MKFLISGIVGCVLLACSAGGSSGGGGVSNGSGGSANGAGAGGAATGGSGISVGGSIDPGTVSCSADCTDFPSTPILDAGVAADAPSKFGDAATGGPSGACIVEPQDGAMIPKNWWRPRVRFTPVAGETTFEIRFHSDIEQNDLVVYTTSTTYSMPADVWKKFAPNAAGQALTITVRGLGASGTPSKATTTLNLAPVDAGGAMVYWATTSTQELVSSSKLVGFRVGEEGEVDALQVLQAKEANLFEYTAQPKTARGGAPAGGVSCVGCHTSTPDGKAVAFKDGWPWAGIMASVEKDTVGQRPSYVTDVGARSIQQPFVGTFAFSKAYWGDSTRLAISVYSNPTAFKGWMDTAPKNITTSAELAWFDLAHTGTVPTDGPSMSTTIVGLENQAWGLIPRTGDTRAAVMPDWSHDGKTIVYTSAAQVAGGHVGGLDPNDPQGKTALTTPTESDIYTVPFNDKAGGAATPLSGAATPGVAEYYPDFSADDQFVAFNRVGTTSGYFYYRADGEIAIIPSAGGTPTRLKANDPPACTGETSPGVLNSWPKWSPIVSTDTAGNKYYFLIFSSARAFPNQPHLTPDQYTPTGTDDRASQLYLATVVVSSSGAITDYPAVYLWNQSPQTSNLTPAWDDFQIPPATVK